MKLLKRFGYYLIGVSLGSILVLVVWKGKDVRFDYGPDARTLSSIRKKVLNYSPEASSCMIQQKIDTAAINYLLYEGDVLFDKSNARKKPCGEYYITGDFKEKKIDFYVVRCDSIATITKVLINN